MHSARIWVHSMCVMARMVTTAKVAAAWKVAAEHGGCWASSRRPGVLLDGFGGRGNVLGRTHVRQMVRACTMGGIKALRLM